MITVCISKAADADLDAILIYSEDLHGAVAADRYLRRIGEVLDRLSLYPELGAPCDTVRPGLRSISAGDHRVYYRIAEATVLVVRVLHKAMDAEAHI